MEDLWKRWDEGLGLLLCAVSLGMAGRSLAQRPFATGKPALQFEPARSQVTEPDRAVREIDDPGSGARWLLLRNPSCPSGPGRLVRMGTAEALMQSGSGEKAPVSRAEAPLIRAGDALVVEEHTPLVDARLVAVALGPAELGAEFRARLQLGGKVVRVVALAPGKAALAAEGKGAR